MAQVTLIGFASTLAAPLMAADTSISLANGAASQLVSQLGDDGYAFLYVHDATGAEVVKASVYGSALTLTRGETPRNFPKGACVDARVTYDGVKDLICNFECCAGDCPCEEVQAAGTALPVAHAGQAWEGMVVFSGAQPMALAVEGAPAWLAVTTGVNFVKLAGTPPAAANYVFSVGATNCNGKVASQPVALNVQG
jgi:hypothetical protein